MHKYNKFTNVAIQSNATRRRCLVVISWKAFSKLSAPNDFFHSELLWHSNIINILHFSHREREFFSYTMQAHFPSARSNGVDASSRTLENVTYTRYTPTIEQYVIEGEMCIVSLLVSYWRNLLRNAWCKKPYICIGFVSVTWTISEVQIIICTHKYT